MARIPDEVIERLKQEVSLERLAEARGVKLTRHGADLLGPVSVPRRSRAVAGHQSEEESVALPGSLPDGRHGDRLGDEAEGVSFRHAVELLRADRPALAKPLPAGEAVDSAQAGAARRPRGRRCAMLEQVVGYYHETLKQSPEALAYLEKRGLEIIRR